MTDRIERFKARRLLQEQLREQPILLELPSVEQVAIIHQPVNQLRIDQAFNTLAFEVDMLVLEADVDAALRMFSEAFSQERFDQLLRESRRDVLQAVAVPFGLGKLVAIHDKMGGNVDTILNARKKIYATAKARQEYADRPEYDSNKYHQNKLYKAKNALDTKIQAEGKLKDTYTGKIMGNKHVDPRNLDHTISAKEIHDDPGRILAGSKGEEIANDSSNLNSTQERFNKFKGQRRADEIVTQLKKESPARRVRIMELEAKTDLTVKERNMLDLDRQKQTIADDPKQFLAADKIARDKYEAKLRDDYHTGEKFRDAVIGTSINEGGKMAFQQAFGFMLVEFFSATFDEIQDFYRKGTVPEIWWVELQSRMERVATRVGKQWKAALAAGGAGFVAGVLSNLVTVFINTLKTTGKRAIRMFREGLMSLLQALKMLAFPSKGMTMHEGAHEALKLVFAGAVVIGGVALEEVVEKYILTIPGLGDLGSIVSAVIIGALTGLASTFVVYLIDRLDPLGVNRDRELMALHHQLDSELEEVRGRNEQWLLSLEATLNC